MEYVIMNGINSLDLDIIIETLAPVSQALRRITTVNVTGRNGNLHIDEGTYEPIATTFTCIAKDISKIDEIKFNLLKPSGTIQFSNIPDKTYEYTITNQVDFGLYLSFLKEFPVQLELQPLAKGESVETTITKNSQEITTKEITNTATLQSVANVIDTLEVNGNTTYKNVGNIITNSAESLSENGDLGYTYKLDYLLNHQLDKFRMSCDIVLVNAIGSGNKRVLMEMRTDNNDGTKSYYSIYKNFGTTNGETTTETLTQEFTFEKRFSSIGYVSIFVQGLESGTAHIGNGSIELLGELKPNPLAPFELLNVDGTITTSYSNNTSSITLPTLKSCKTAKDTMLNNDVTTNVGSVILDGVTNKFTELTKTGNVLVLNYKNADIKKLADTSVICPVSSHFRSDNINTTWSGQAGYISQANNGNYLQCSISCDVVGETLESANAWLQDNNVVVYYEKETPVKTTLTNNKLQTYYPSTYIRTDSEVDVTFTITYIAGGVINYEGTADVKPVITVIGTGTFSINNTMVRVDESGIVIDCEKMVVYKDNESKTDKVNLTEFPTLHNGENAVALGTCEQLIISYEKRYI